MAIRENTGVPLEPEAALEEIFQRIAERCRIVARRAIPSRTLREALRIVRAGEYSEASEALEHDGLYLPHYWAKYYHDGRGPTRPVRKRKIVFFGDIRKDPRQGLGKSYPVKVSDIRPFTAAEFYEQLKRNERRSNPRNIMQVKNSAGPAQGVRFFETGMAGILQDIDARAEIVPVLNRVATIGLPSGEENLTISL